MIETRGIFRSTIRLNDFIFTSNNSQFLDMESGIRNQEIDQAQKSVLITAKEYKKVVKFEDLEVWKESMRLASKIYQEMKNCRDFGFRDQIQRSAVSIPSNISEGFDRSTNREFIQYLHIARGSCSEVRTQLYLAENIGLIENKTAQLLLEQSRKISSMLSRRIQTRNEKF